MFDLNSQEWCSRELGRDKSYLSTMCYTSKEKWEIITSFDDKLYISILKYKEWLINLFHKASIIEMNMEDKKEKNKVLLALGLKSHTRVKDFEILINSVIDEGNFLSIRWNNIKKVINFVELYGDN